jgi:hypothetical protein
MANNVSTWRTECECGQYVYWYPVNLILEGNIPYDFNKERIINLECDCGKTKNYHYPKDNLEKII